MAAVYRAVVLLSNLKIALIGYGNQGRAQALNLRDSGHSILLGLRSGPSWEKAVSDGFRPLTIEAAISQAELVMFLLPDRSIEEVFALYSDQLDSKILGFAHGFAIHFGWIKTRSRYFLVGPKGAGAVLRSAYESGKTLPGVYALSDDNDQELNRIALEYAAAIGISPDPYKTSFREEVECDLFGEQVVLCGGLPQLMEAAFSTLVERGYSKEMAFYECCFEAKMILELWMSRGPSRFSSAISKTAFYGGLTRGRTLIDDQLKKRLHKVLDEIQTGAFTQEYRRALDSGMEATRSEQERLKLSLLEKTFQEINLDLPEAPIPANAESRRPSKSHSDSPSSE